MTISKTEFKRRRKQLMRSVGEGNIALVPSAPPQIRNRDVDHPYRQDSDFFYLTGFNEADSLVALIPGREQGEFIIFCREFDEKKALWEGAHAGLEGAQDYYSADDAFPITDIDEILPGMLENCGRVYYPIGGNHALDHQILEWLNQLKRQARMGVRAPMELVSLEHLLHEMRLIKSREEIRLMQKAISISDAAHRRAMGVCKSGLYEYQIEAEILHEFTRQGARSAAYPSIVAGGTNACVLHYTENKDRLKKNSLLLIDAGAEYQCYASDITRTFPVSGRFNQEQAALYELVLDAQLAAIDKVRPGNHWNEPHDAAVRVLTKGLTRLGLLEGRLKKLLKDEAYKAFYMHRTGHWLGMDVHDVGEYKIGDDWRIFEPGMVLTVEPGLYISPACTEVEPKWRGIGIRIEDDVLVTKKGCDVLSADIPKTIAEIEQAMSA